MGLDKCQCPEVQRGQLKSEREDHAGQPGQPDRTASYPERSQTPSPSVSLLLMPSHWHTEYVAVQKLAARASGIALSIFPRSAYPAASQSPQRIFSCWLPVSSATDAAGARLADRTPADVGDIYWNRSLLKVAANTGGHALGAGRLVAGCYGSQCEHRSRA
jgi:hypothetical protein